MSYTDRADGYKGGLTYGAIGVGVLAALWLLGTCSNLAKTLPPTTTLDAEQQLLNDPQSGEVFRTIKRTYPAEFDGLKNEIAQRGAQFQSRQDIAEAGRAFLIAAMKRHLGDMVQAPHAALADYRKAEITSIKALQAGDIAACASYFSTGVINLPDAAQDVKSALVNFQIKSWTTEAAGRDQPAGRTVSKPAVQDLRTIAAGAAGLGSTESDVNNLFSGVRMADKAQCTAGLALVQGIDALPDAKADNFTAFLMQIAAAKR